MSSDPKKADETITKSDANTTVLKTVEHIIADIEERGDVAVLALSEQFDGWTPKSFRLSDDEVDAAMAAVQERTIDDICLAQDQIRNFARIQLASMQDVEVKTQPGVILSHMNMSGC
jgi:sulfopropanediol 3-dehydrogenase